eukprot:3461454-Amphidinium_carterae.1
MKGHFWTLQTLKVLRRPTWPCVPEVKSRSALEHKGLLYSVTRSVQCSRERYILPANMLVSPVTRSKVHAKSAGSVPH